MVAMSGDSASKDEPTKPGKPMPTSYFPKHGSLKLLK